MFDYFLERFISLSFIFIIYISILCHTVVYTTDIVPLNHNETYSKIIEEQLKREGKKQGKIENLNQSGTINMEEAHESLDSSNITIHNKPIIVGANLNSTANLPTFMLNFKEGALQRTGFVMLGFVSIVVIFFVVRIVRIRQKRSKSRKYGIITSNVSDMEMEPLDRDDDEEEDATLFDAQHKYSLQ